VFLFDADGTLEAVLANDGRVDVMLHVFAYGSDDADRTWLPAVPAALARLAP
jgi:hypothetical protein